jgi:hypothetical protein
VSLEFESEEAALRFQVQILTTGSRSQERVASALADGLVADADVTPAFVQGIADEDQVRQLGELGLQVSVLGQIPDVPERTGRGAPRGGVFSKRTASIGGGGATAEPRQEGYYVLSLRGLLTTQVRDRLSAAGVSILERIGDGRWSVKLSGRPGDIRRIATVAAFDPVRAERTGGRLSRAVGGARGRSAGTASPIDAGHAGYEAILQIDADPEQLAARMAGMGAALLSPAGRVVRFTCDPRQLDAIVALPGVASVSAAGVPRLLHDMARPLIGIDAGVSDRPGGLTGEGEVVGIADTGIDASHPDFVGRIRRVVPHGRPGDGSDPNGHGTHVAGTIAGDGAASAGLLAGVAPRAEIFFQSLMDGNGELGGLPIDIADLFQEAYDADVRVHNNSWGIFLNARYSGPSLQVDGFVEKHPDFLPVIAAGNDGSCLPGLNAGGSGLVDFPSMAVPATAKNALVVGASRSSRTKLGYSSMTYGQTWPENFNAPPIADANVSGDPAGLAAFSARGPTDDFRIKPDVVAPGTDIASTRSADAPLRNFWGAYPNNDRYALMGGTSMACPMVTGLAVLVRQYYRQTRSHSPSAALLRATVINGTERLAGSDAVANPAGDPNYHQGFGRVNLARTVPTGQPGFALSFVDADDAAPEIRQSGDMVAFGMNVATDGELRLCLAWTDPPGRALQNALFMTAESPTGDLLVSNAGIVRQIAFPTPLPPGFPPSTFNRDPNNNVHVLRLPQATAGRYTVTVASIDVIRPQAFALVATGAVGPIERI